MLSHTGKWANYGLAVKMLSLSPLRGLAHESCPIITSRRGGRAIVALMVWAQYKRNNTTHFSPVTSATMRLLRHSEIGIIRHVERDDRRDVTIAGISGPLGGPPYIVPIPSAPRSRDHRGVT